jgi:cell division protein FtsL
MEMDIQIANPTKLLFSKENLIVFNIGIIAILLSTAIIYCKHNVRRLNTVIGIVEKQIHLANEEYRLMLIENSTYLNKLSPEYLRKELEMEHDKQNLTLKLK